MKFLVYPSSCKSFPDAGLEERSSSLNSHVVSQFQPDRKYTPMQTVTVCLEQRKKRRQGTLEYICFPVRKAVSKAFMRNTWSNVNTASSNAPSPRTPSQHFFHLCYGAAISRNRIICALKEPILPFTCGSHRVVRARIKSCDRSENVQLP